MGTISKNFSYWEFEASETADRKGICNVINTFEVRDAVKALVETVLQPLRDNWGKPLHINSGYRCPALNKALKGAKNSQHTKGQAADIASDNPHGLAELVLHISHKHPGPQRGVVLYDEGYEGEYLA